MKTRDLVEASRVGHPPDLRSDNTAKISWHALKSIKVGEVLDIAVLNPPTTDNSDRTPDDTLIYHSECDPYRIKVKVTTEIEQDEEPDIHGFNARCIKSGGPYHIVGKTYYVYGVPNDFWQITHTLPSYPNDAADIPDERDPEVDFGPQGHEPGLYESDQAVWARVDLDEPVHRSPFVSEYVNFINSDDPPESGHELDYGTLEIDIPPGFKPDYMPVRATIGGAHPCKFKFPDKATAEYFLRTRLYRQDKPLHPEDLKQCGIHESSSIDYDTGKDFTAGEFTDRVDLTPGASYRLHFELIDGGEGKDEVVFLGQADRVNEVTFYFLTKEGKVFYIGSNPSHGVYDDGNYAGGTLVVNCIGSAYDGWEGEMDWPVRYEQIDALGYPIPPTWQDGDGGISTPDVEEEWEEDMDLEDD